jgi:hypothetical protein
LAGPIVGERGAIAWTDAHARALRARRGEYRVVCTAKKGYDSEEIELHFYSCLCTVVSSLMWRRGQLLERERQLTSKLFSSTKIPRLVLSYVQKLGERQRQRVYDTPELVLMVPFPPSSCLFRHRPPPADPLYSTEWCPHELWKRFRR